MNLTTCQDYARQHGIAVSTVTLHARKLGIEPIAGRYLFSKRDIARLDRSIVGKRGRPRKEE